MNSQKHHIVWDWNGTLFNDSHAVLDATNATFEPFGITLTQHEYRSVFQRPLGKFYSNILGRDVSEEELRSFDAVFHHHYLRVMQQCDLALDARSTLAEWSDEGCTQSLLSLWEHERLHVLVSEREIAQYFLRIDGRRSFELGSKAEPLVRHLAKADLNSHHVTIIGDALDDAAAAKHAGTACVLYNNGYSHTDEELRATGFPVAHSLQDAVKLATAPNQ